MSRGKSKRRPEQNLLARTASRGRNPESQLEMPKGIHAASPANISEYMMAIERMDSQIGGKRPLKTIATANRSKYPAKAVRARRKKPKRGLPTR
jgi:hypothetical protein